MRFEDTIHKVSLKSIYDYLYGKKTAPAYTASNFTARIAVPADKNTYELVTFKVDKQNRRCSAISDNPEEINVLIENETCYNKTGIRDAGTLYAAFLLKDILSGNKALSATVTFPFGSTNPLVTLLRHLGAGNFEDLVYLVSKEYHEVIPGLPYYSDVDSTRIPERSDMYIPICSMTDRFNYLGVQCAYHSKYNADDICSEIEKIYSLTELECRQLIIQFLRSRLSGSPIILKKIVSTKWIRDFTEFDYHRIRPMPEPDSAEADIYDLVQLVFYCKCNEMNKWDEQAKFILGRQSLYTGPSTDIWTEAYITILPPEKRNRIQAKMREGDNLYENNSTFQ